jgi:hypothetical protein
MAQRVAYVTGMLEKEKKMKKIEEKRKNWVKNGG